MWWQGAGGQNDSRPRARQSLAHFCRFSWPITDTAATESHVGDTAAQSAIISAVTGKRMYEHVIYQIGERVFNLRRAVTDREGHKGREDGTLQESDYFVLLSECKFEYHEFANPRRILPGRDGATVSREDAVVVDRDKFEGVKDEYYQLRGWDVATGMQTRAKLEKLGLVDVARELAARGLAW